jgi:hypothetical protein
MTVKVSSDNVFGEEIKAIQENQADRTNIIADLNNQVDIDRELNRVYSQLPAQQDVEASINFLGSSYSGTDIKVVAHLYDTANWRDEEIKKREDELKIMQDITDGCFALKGGPGLGRFADDNANNVLLFDERRTLFIQATGLNEKDQQPALQQMLSQIFRTGNFSFLGVARMRRDTERLLKTAVLRDNELKDQIKNLKEIESDSSTTVALGTLQTISVQSHREKGAVRALGHSYVKGYTRGPRTIAGSMIFTIFNEHALLKLIRSMASSQHYGERDAELSTLIPDQLPPIDVTIVFANEYGSISDFRLYGLEFVNDGATYSIEDLLSEQIINFVCRDADVMTSRGKVRLSRLQAGMFSEIDGSDVSASSLVFDNNDYETYLDKLKIRRRIKNR